MLKRLLAGGRGRTLAIGALRSYLVLALRTTRWTFDIHPDALPVLTPRDGRSALVAFWHETLVLTPALWWWAARRDPSLRMHVLVSRNRDGRMIADIVAPWGVDVIAGSTDRRNKDKGGAAALRGLLGQLGDGSLIAVTPDGPRGPRRHAQQGVAGLALLSGAPVVPVGAWCRSWRLGTWDRMLIPLPFGRGRVVCGAPVMPARGDRAAAARRIGDAIDAATEAACPPPAGGLSRLWALLATLIAPGLILLLRRRLARGKERPGRLRERMGLTARARPAGRLVWLHAASVGESLSILPVIDRMMARDPALHVLLTTATVNAADLLDRRLAGAAWGGRVIHQFVPLDVPRWIGRFLRHWRPDAAALTESELWPNLIEACHRSGVPIALMNARLSDRSRDGWRRMPGLARRMLSRFGWIAARSAEDAARLRALGATRVDVPGDLKEAAAPLPADPAQLAGIVDAIAGRPVWLAASTHDGEEDLIAQADRLIRARHPDLLTVIVPRHPERGAAIAACLETPPVPRRALSAIPCPADRFWICDTLGELGLFYRAVPIVFIGNSLPGPGRGGGHNPMEPARLGAALASGPLTDNFTEAFARLGDAVAIVADPAALAEWVDGLLSDPARLAQARRHAAPVAGDPDLPDRMAARLLTLAGG
ncbi:glycosyltransferase N-terminal domain-containing protein [Gluconacetobacter johannae]|uniref:3-deoxy-D-manno-octulosonic acid transferase n=1 Tax=Gluconacetobacter johannae TaxID=112140 RepID=A0A7W4J891_9PROT|nr:glycosyltransferase N-terminal domain-containing protein [Gluconacetobacter johannae]MBB2176499.1 DUF374 domain-containing protein [Gluconacetobacter johannae]